MFGRLLLLFILLPFLEFALLLVIAEHTSWQFTLGLIIVTGVVGAWLARREGTQCLGRIQSELSQGQMPGDSLVDGMMILVAGAMLITPGIITDIFGFSLLIPPMRFRLKQLVIARLKHRIVVSGFSSVPQSGPQPGSGFEDAIDVDHRPTEPPATD